MPLAAGTRLGAYEILALLGEGGMGVVYRALDTRLGREIALKVLPAEFSASPERLARFDREARIVANLTHPNIVTLHSIEDAGGTRFLTMELVEGRSLADLVSPGGLPLDRVLDLAIPLLDALVAAHEKKVVHRDLKPANVLVTGEGRVKVLDFGLAKLTRPEPDLQDSRPAMTAPLSTAGVALGTAPYMAPEQILGEAVDARTDLFAVGVLVFELVTGRRPFLGKTLWAVTAAILSEPAPSLGSVRTGVPAELERIVDRCLEKEPRDRFQSARDVVNELRELRRALEHGGAPAARTAPVSVASVAVLPFLNRSASPDDEYFSEGLADELLSLLARIKGLRVSARASSFQFRGRNVPPADIGRALNVATLLDGSVRRAGNRVRIAVQLVDVTDGSHLWSDTYDRTLDDIFAVQDDIARSVVKQLRATLLGEVPDSGASGRAQAEVDRAGRGRSSDPEAHRLFLLARHFMSHLSREATAKAIGYLKLALERDPDFALAWAELSVAYVREVGWTLVPMDEGYERARHAVERALELEPNLADAHVQIAWIRMFHERDWAGAEDSLSRARELAPGSARVIRLSGVMAGILGRTHEAIGLFRRALEQDPLSAAAYHSLGVALQAVDEVQSARDAFIGALELSPQRYGTHAHLALTALAQGRHEEAIVEASREPEEGFRLWATAIVYHTIGDQSNAEAAVRQLIDRHADTFALQVAEVYALGGDADAAFDWLNRAYLKRDPGLSGMRINPRLRSLHDDSRWSALLQRMRFDA